MKLFIRGVGLVTCLGSTLESFWGSINRGENGFRPFSSLTHLELNGCYCGKVNDFNPSDYYPEKALADADRSAALIAVATQSALRDSSIQVDPSRRDRIGISSGITLSIATSMSEFYESVLVNGPRRCKIAAFPNTVMNAPASRVAILEEITGANTTISSGINSGIDAIGLACLSISEGISDSVVCGGVEALSERILLGFAKRNLLTYGIDLAQSEVRCKTRLSPYESFIPSEGAVVFVIDEVNGMPHHRYCAIVGYSCTFSPDRIQVISKRSENVERTLRMAIEEAGIHLSDIGLTILSAGFDQFSYEASLVGLERVFGTQISQQPILYPKWFLGECGAVLGPQCILIAQGYFDEIFEEPVFQRINANMKWHCQLHKKNYVAIVHTDTSGHNSVMIVTSS